MSSAEEVPLTIGKDGRLRGLTDFGDVVPARKGARNEFRGSGECSYILFIGLVGLEVWEDPK